MKGKVKIASAALAALTFIVLILPLSTSFGQLALPPLPVEGLPSLGGGGQNTGTTPGYGGYGNGAAAQVNLPAGLGTADVGVASSAVNSSGGIVKDWSGTPQDESKATAVGEVETLGVHKLLGNDDLDFSFGSAGSSFPPSTGIIGSVQEISLPGAGQVFAGFYKTVSTEDSSQNELTVLLVNIEALDLDLAIPLVQSTSSTKKEGAKVSSDATSDVIASDPNSPLVIGEGLIGGNDALSAKLINAGSHSEADGATAGSSSSWTLVDLAVAGIPVIVVDSQSGAMFAGATLIPAPGGGSLLIVEPFPGVIGVFVGETWSDTDGKSFAYGGANVLRVSLLDKGNFLVFGHAGTGANTTFSDGPGAGPGQDGEGSGNLSPTLADPPNDVPIGFTTGEGEIGPPPDDKNGDDNEKNDGRTIPGPLLPAAAGGPGQAGAGDGGAAGLTRAVLPLTGIQSLLLVALFAALSSILAMKLVRKRKSGLASVSQAPGPVKVAPVRVNRDNDREILDLQTKNSLSAKLRPGNGLRRDNLLSQQSSGTARSRHIYAPVRVKRRRRFFT